jgi:tRNA threonylcarbamoyl adenosine modification protein YeaZ
MDTLFLDFCSNRKLFALIADTVVLAETELADHTDEASVMPAILRLLTKAGRTPASIGRIAAVTGPGGFMSQRVGLAVANALAWGLKIPIGGLHLSDLYAARTAGDVMWIHSTKKELLFVRPLNQKTEPETMTLDALAKLEGMYVGEVLPEQAAKLKMKPCPTLKKISDVLPHVVNALSFSSTPLTPWYGRGA